MKLKKIIASALLGLMLFPNVAVSSLAMEAAPVAEVNSEASARDGVQARASYYIVNGTNVNLRSAASTSSASKGQLSYGGVVRLVSTSGSWKYVEVIQGANQGLYGWVYSQYLSFMGNSKPA